MSKRPLYALALAGAMVPMAANAECGEVSVGEMNWTTGGIMTGITEFLLEQGYGCDVKVVPSQTTAAISSLAENNEPDIVPDMWVNSAPSYFDLAEQGKVQKASDTYTKGGTEHWLLPRYLVEEHPELGTIEGVLNNPELVGRFNNCPDGWGCRIVNDSLIEALDLEGNGIEVFNHGSGQTLKASMASAYQNKEPWFGYYWGPTAPLGKYDMVSIDLGEYKPEVHANNQDPESDEVGVSAFPSASVFNIVTTDFAEREPEAFAMLQNMTVENETMNELLAWYTDNEATNDEAVVRYLQNNQEEWMSWISEDAKANLQGMF
ncbi:glycine betaine ABC transporter substrate-binding protein [Spiribacter vilamensis]|uniref:Glycine betaine/proline transport system substrate-binding protein n=1 Tax=Spiribacter vilamensis TaxID=531306 RepID=A0A4Q8CYY8_9GAMM|nr:glycine betaine ABC transporter substrate-binding protein [Spiribacter vilamensis]RZU98226.1 glycine betaine/proline transport system substrate-binding protein [Spiribacter vilamensis]TVO60874.1 glycine/betaine ABC transporter substrate-binding protein [Spiribacter vilamensis]